MKIILALCACFFAVPAHAQHVTPPDETRSIGRLVPDATLIDDQGEPFQLRSLVGKPLIISPIFTRCPHACTMITSSLRDATASIDGLGDDYNVLTISFDPGDTAVDIAAYRDRLVLPAGWHIGIAAANALAPVLDALDFRFSPVQDGFAHPNVIAVIDADGRISGYVHGVSYEEDDIRRALTTAWAGESLVKKYRFWITGIAGAFALATVLVVIISGRHRRGAPV